MDELMPESGGVALRVLEGLEGRHLHVVRAFGVVGPGSAVADFNAGRGEEDIGGLDALGQEEGMGLGLRVEVGGQPVALLW
jgi:hypothetical protein